MKRQCYEKLQQSRDDSPALEKPGGWILITGTDTLGRRALRVDLAHDRRFSNNAAVKFCKRPLESSLSVHTS